MPFSVLPDSIPPMMSSTRSALTVTSPEVTVKSVPSNVATPGFVSLASSPANVTVLPLCVTFIPSPPERVRVSLSRSIGFMLPVSVAALIAVEPNWSSTYFLLAMCASAVGAAFVAMDVPSATVPTVNSPLAVKLPVIVVTPAANVPVVLKFSLPKLIAPEESVIEPADKSNVDTSRSVAMSTLAGNPTVKASPLTATLTSLLVPLICNESPDSIIEELVPSVIVH